MTRTEIISRITVFLEKIASADHLARIYRFVKYVYIHVEGAVEQGADDRVYRPAAEYDR